MPSLSKRRWILLATAISIPVLTASHLWAYQQTRRKELTRISQSVVVEDLSHAVRLAKAWPCGATEFQTEFALLNHLGLLGSAMNVEAEVLPQLRSEGRQEETHELELMIDEARTRADSLKALETRERLDALSECTDGRWVPGGTARAKNKVKTPVNHDKTNRRRGAH